MEKTHSNTRTLQYLNCFKFVYFSGREKRKLMTSINGSQSEVNQEIEAVVALEPRKNDYNVSQNSNESTFLAKMHIIAAIHYWLITLLIPTKC